MVINLVFLWKIECFPLFVCSFLFSSTKVYHSEHKLALSVNTTLSGPLLSRFDIVLVLLDTKNPEWDAVVSSHILAEVYIIVKDEWLNRARKIT